MRYFPVLLLLSCLGLLTACQSTTSVKHDPEPHFLDFSFAGYQQVAIETEADIFRLNDEAKAFVRGHVVMTKNATKRMENLVDAIFDRSDFNMLYNNQANTVAEETFTRRSANCLSLSILTYALAKEAGLGVQFREIQIPEYWTRRQGYSLINGHVNLRLFDPQEAGAMSFGAIDLVVDFDPFSPKKYFPAAVVEKNRVIAMFYNNKGADALVNEQYTRAYAYLRAAIQTDNSFQDAWANMGILYRMTGHYDWAENIYLAALQLNDNNLTIWENLAVLHRYLGREARAADIEMTVSQKRQKNPFYHYMLGEQQMELNEYQLAMSHFRRAIRLDSTYHEFYFGMAKAHYQIGDTAAALTWLKRAKRNAKVEELRDRYQNKMDLFASL